ncbi:helix-turn-helix transcriptional regulator [Mariniflexile sp. AS56]|uniref:helix-turn-helix transcriptional regulator n=1 Tax=Mariniflexile sp. AS56 TaxID=3063957 RepID=UPI0026EC2B9F|nr:hypothetical protein [Mariniflexile sp. AS56]MDO7171717.1 hypothetical protein [Mariniflexile sp. AS56]
MYFLKLRLSHPYLLLLVFLLCFTVLSQNSHEGRYLKYIDSAYNILNESPKVAAVYLDSIPEPLKKNIIGHLACYYDLRALISDRNHERLKLYQNYVLALKYAELEENYDVAGKASLELFYNTYLIKKDTSAFKYLEAAKRYYTLSGNKNGLLEVMQMPAYVEFYNGNYQSSNKLILEQLEVYKSIKEDAYYYMYALFMLTSNYLDLGDISNSHKYFKIFKSLEENSTLSLALYKSHLATIYGSMSNLHFKKKNIDSTQYYISQSKELRNAMNEVDRRNFYSLHVDYYDYIKDFEYKNNYIDSLKYFENEVLSKTMDASLNLGDSLLISESELKIEKAKLKNNFKWVVVLIFVLIALIVLFIFKSKKSKKTIKHFEKSNNEYTYLKSNHEKLKVKVRGLEDYISDVKKEIKHISSLDAGVNQRIKIKDLFKNLQLDSSMLLDKMENQLELVNELNIEFFTQLRNGYPQLNDSELIICYYLFVGFKSKEIALFVNSSTRAIEGKRYRISKKMNLQESDLTLADFLNQKFKDTKTEFPQKSRV